MSIALNVMMIMLCINLFLYLGYKADLIGNCMSTAFTTLAAIAGDQSITWTDIVSSTLNSFITSLPLVGVLILVMVVLSKVTGSFTIGLTTGVGGGGYGAAHALTIVAIVIFTNFVAMPDISAMGFPTEVAYITRIIIGSMILASIFGLMKGE